MLTKFLGSPLGNVVYISRLRNEFLGHPNSLLVSNQRKAIERGGAGVDKASNTLICCRFKHVEQAGYIHVDEGLFGNGRKMRGMQRSNMNYSINALHETSHHLSINNVGAVTGPPPFH